MFIHYVGSQGSHGDGQDVACCKWETPTAHWTARKLRTGTQFKSSSCSSSLEKKHSQHMPRKPSRQITRGGGSRTHTIRARFLTAAQAVTAALQCLLTGDLQITSSQRHRLTSHASPAFVTLTKKLIRTDSLALKSPLYNMTRAS